MYIYTGEIFFVGSAELDPKIDLPEKIKYLASTFSLVCIFSLMVFSFSL